MPVPTAERKACNSASGLLKHLPSLVLPDAAHSQLHGEVLPCAAADATHQRLQEGQVASAAESTCKLLGKAPCPGSGTFRPIAGLLLASLPTCRRATQDVSGKSPPGRALGGTWQMSRWATAT